MFNIVLFNPQIPPNTGNILRLCANTGCKIHLIEPLGFSLDKKSLRRAGLDYYKNVKINVYKNIDDFLSKNINSNIYLITKFGNVNYSKIKYRVNDYLMFGSEIHGLSNEVYQKLDSSEKIFIPMLSNNRSINLSNAVSVCIYEAWKQNNFLTP
jgi:tRNA (cytidine/uridine-2'-O-)-methyltransferase|tara:strand:+ start:251 stop:712 length:462 start_codon:yes stop_codon:yes gene_type:complete